jgi:hypothetical protein
MPLRGRTSRLYRLLGSCLAVTGLLGHGLAMLLLASLVPSTAEAGVPAYGEICTAEGLVATAGFEHEENDRAPGHPAGHLDPCPVCTAFAQYGTADLPAAAALTATAPAGAVPPPVQDARPPSVSGLIPLSRGPPAVA